ncbi:MAG: alpha/beta hydrolase [Gammaproteobacteria bacterium]|nr:MAG: alpha/beta hydrolase [Gammaproteobacteria bacterium]
MLLVIIIIPYVIACIYIYSQQKSLIYYPVKEWVTTPDREQLPYENVSLMSSDRVRLSAWYIPRAGSHKVILFAHGNAGNISHRLDSIRIFYELGFNVLIFDYRGYGKSEGQPSEAGIYRDIDAAWRYLTQTRKFKARQIVLFGRSLGGAVAVDLATRQTPAALIVESSFSSVRDMADQLFIWFPSRLLLRYHYRTIDKMAQINSPLLVLHSPDDDIIPFRQGVALYNAAKQPKVFARLAGGHNEGFLLNRRAYKQQLKTFLGGIL